MGVAQGSEQRSTYEFDIQDFGARPDGVSINTAAIQRAIDACHETGGGRVVCGPGTYVTGSIELKSNVELHLVSGCRLVGSRDVTDYEEFVAEGFHGEYAAENCTRHLIRAVDAENVAVTGAGEVDGVGLNFYDTNALKGKFFAKPITPRPRLVMFYRCRDVRFEGVSFLDSPCWTMWLMKCERVFIHKVRVLGDRRMINNDGIDLDSCKDVVVSDCIIKTADDCLVIRSITKMFDQPAPCENVTITNCVLDSACQGVRIGCPGDYIVRNCILNNLVINSSGNGIVFDNPARYLPKGTDGTADVHNVTISDVIINCDYAPIKICVEEGVKLPRLGRLSFSNVRAQSGRACQVQGNSETIIQDVSFRNVDISTTDSEPIILKYAEGIKMDQVSWSYRSE